MKLKYSVVIENIIYLFLKEILNLKKKIIYVKMAEGKCFILLKSPYS